MSGISYNTWNSIADKYKWKVVSVKKSNVKKLEEKIVCSKIRDGVGYCSTIFINKGGKNEN